MNIKQFDDETLMAFADGELDEATALRIEAALENDEVLAARLAVFLDTRMTVASAMKPLIDEPVPDVLSAAVRRMAQRTEAKSADEANVLAFRSQKKPETRISRQQWLMPIAASIFAVVIGVGGFMAGRSVETAASFNVALAVALDQQPSGSELALGDAETLHIIASFIDGRGELCREYELSRQQESIATVACRINGAWVTRLALSSPHAEGYVPASSQETIDTYLAAIEAGEPLSTEDEKNALAKPE